MMAINPDDAASALVSELSDRLVFAYGVPLSNSAIVNLSNIPSGFSQLNAAYQYYVKALVEYINHVKEWSRNVQETGDIVLFLKMFRLPPPELFAEYVQYKQVGESALFDYLDTVGAKEPIQTLFLRLEGLMSIVVHNISEGLAPSFNMTEQHDLIDTALYDNEALTDFMESHVNLTHRYFGNALINSTRTLFRFDEGQQADEADEKKNEKKIEVADNASTLYFFSHLFFTLDLNFGSIIRYPAYGSTLFALETANGNVLSNPRFSKALDRQYYPMNLNGERFRNYSLFNLYHHFFIQNNTIKNKIFVRQTKKKLEDMTKNNKRTMEFYLHGLARRYDMKEDAEMIRDAYLLMRLYRTVDENRNELKDKARDILEDNRFSVDLRFGILQVYFQTFFLTTALTGARSETQYFTDNIKNVIRDEIIGIMEHIYKGKTI